MNLIHVSKYHMPCRSVALFSKLSEWEGASSYIWFVHPWLMRVCVHVREVFCRNSHSPECHRKPLRSVSGAWEGSAGLLRQRRVEEQVSGVTSLKNRSIVAVRKQLTAGKNHSRSTSRHTHANKHSPSGKTHTHTHSLLH